ncbi:regulator of G-protein signaling 12-like isoform X2 [Mercenaria mercenaria]|uniref:regulator of G-protein signaling 12-like isoform X2 n=1 Tax=Mercenaria mercenaria TaxID=6596 RepID=UPI00234F5168|nr:regulator of G-protein signaling 12-like isoform X2 [Mercenaria mercenaria]
MYPPQQLHQPKRRKKRPIHGLKTVDVVRGKSGYGFTISGQHPCVLSCIVNNSPAERVGLRPGDYLMSVNGIDVSKHSHDDVVCMVGTSTGTLTIQVAENYNSSDSSDDDYYHRTKAKYPHRARKGHKGYNEKMEKLLADINQRDRPDGHTHDPNSRPLPNNYDNKKYDLPKSRSSRPRLHTPVGAENHEIQSEGTSYIEAGATNVFKVPFQKSASASNVPSAASLPLHHKVEPKHAFIKSTSQGHVKSLAGSNTMRSLPSHFKHGRMYDQFSPNSLQQIINHSLHSYSAANEAFILNEDDFDDDDYDDNALVPNSGQEVRIVVGYIGSLEMPGDAHQPHVRIQSIRNAVRRLRVEQKIHTLVLMVVSPDIGVRLINMMGKEIAFYPVERLAFSGVCPDDKRFFGIVTLRSVSDDSDSDSDSREELVGSSCHVFMVDQELTAHNVHALKAKSFGINCTVDQHTQRCLEFPRSTTPIILSISNLYKDRPGVGMENDVARSKVFSNPSQPVQHMRMSSTSSNNSNSDSGLGLGREDNRPEHAPVIEEMPPPPIPARDRPAPQLPQIKWSGNTMYLTDGPMKYTKHSKQNAVASKDNSLDMSASNEEFIRATDRLNIRAMPNVTPDKRRLSADGLENQNTAENLRLGMQKLLQARQRQAGLDQTSSDTESRSSRSDIRMSSSDLQERPVSAPFKYLSDESDKPLQNFGSQGDVKPVQSFVHMKHDSDSSLADKLSPRAFLSSAFTPVGSVGSAFKKTRSRPQLHEMRSPSAPPIPSYHGDDEDSDEEAGNNMIKRFQKAKSLGLSKEVAETPGTSMGTTEQTKRDQERRSIPVSGTPDVVAKSSVSNSTDKWTKGQQGSLRRKSRCNPLSLSHESLVVLDQDPVQQKLSSANSVNSIVNHVATSIEQEQVGRVSSWAVSFDKLLKDSIGITVFTEFLKKEFSEENVVFWKACEDFKNIIDSNYRKSKAQELYDKHVSVRACECVNIDSVARKAVESQLENPTPQTFDTAQQQIFQLMKQDSYSRFLKSSLYKSYMMDEMEGKPLLVASDTPQDKNKLLDKVNEKDGKKKGKGKENEENKDKRRRSLLPWRQKSKKQSKSETDSKNQKSVKETKDINANTTPAVPSSNPESSTNTKKEPVHVEVPETIEEEPEQPRFCRVIMPDGSTTVVGTRQGQTINYILGKLCEKRGLSVASVDVFLLGSEKPLNLNDDISTLGSKEVTIERRVLFRMDLPNKKSIGVKAKPNRLIRDVFKPILNKYGYRIDAIDVHLSGQSDRNLCLDNLVSSIDSQRVIVLNQASDIPDPECSAKVMIAEVDPSLDLCGPGTGEQEVGEVLTKDHGKVSKTRQKVTFDLQKNTVRNQRDDEDDSLCERLKRAQNLSLDDQRGLAPQDVELPDFLRTTIDHDVLPTGRESAPASISQEKVSLSTQKNTRNFMSEIDNYIESINENFAAYTRESTPVGKSPQTMEVKRLPVKSSDKSFSEDGIVPSNDEADIFFRVPSNSDGVDFNDPHLTEKSLKDIGFSYSHNKYLSKSRNFVNHRKKNLNSQIQPSVQIQEPPLAFPEILSPNQTLRSDQLNQSDLLDSTLLNSPHSSPYSSDSSLDKENLSKLVPKSKASVQKSSRHTLIHSPITGVDGDRYLSTVDTDGKLTRHSTPNTSKGIRLSNAGRTPKIVNSTNDKQCLDVSHVEEVTFV